MSHVPPLAPPDDLALPRGSIDEDRVRNPRLLEVCASLSIRMVMFMKGAAARGIDDTYRPCLECEKPGLGDHAPQVRRVARSARERGALSCRTGELEPEQLATDVSVAGDRFKYPRSGDVRAILRPRIYTTEMSTISLERHTGASSPECQAAQSHRLEPLPPTFRL